MDAPSHRSAGPTHTSGLQHVIGMLRGDDRLQSAAADHHARLSDCLARLDHALRDTLGTEDLQHEVFESAPHLIDRLGQLERLGHGIAAEVQGCVRVVERLQTSLEHLRASERSLAKRLASLDREHAQLLLDAVYSETGGEGD
jgi:hypothetical protein